MPPEQGPLAGLQVIAVEQFGAGPWGTGLLASLGATVIKIEDPSVGGDVGRYVGPFQEGSDSLFFEAFNGGKLSLTLDLRHPRGTEVLHRLAATSDALVCNLRGDLPARLGLDYQALAPANPRIVCCSLSGYGSSGPRAEQGAYDYAIQARAGWMQLTGGPDEPPTRSGVSLVDFCGGLAAATAVLAGLHRAQATGVGCDCDLALFDVALSLTNYLATWTLSQGWEAARTEDSAHQSVVPFQLFPTADGWIVICCAKDSLFTRLCTALDVEWMATDSRYSSITARREHRDSCVPVLRDRLRTRTTDQWLHELEAAGVPCGPVNDLAQAFADPQVAPRQMVDSYDHPALGTVHTPGSPLRVAGYRRQPQRAPFLGEHAEQVLREACGYEPSDIAELRRSGALGSTEGVAP